MKLIIHDSLAHPTFRGVQAPKVSFNRSNGSVTLNKFAYDLMGLKPEQKIALIQDAENSKNWFLAKSEDGFIARKTSNSQSLTFANKSLVVHFMKSMGWEEQTAKIQVGTEWLDHSGLRLFPLISSSIQSNGQYQRREVKP